MKTNLFTLTKQAQDVLLRLFIESGEPPIPYETRYYIGARCGTFSRMHN